MPMEVPKQCMHAPCLFRPAMQYPLVVKLQNTDKMYLPVLLTNSDLVESCSDDKCVVLLCAAGGGSPDCGS